MSKPTVEKVTMAGEEHAVLTVKGGGKAYMRTPCAECPWRQENAGTFPVEAFRISACTSKDMAPSTFACHMKGKDHPTTCAGFLLSESAKDNFAVRVNSVQGLYRDLMPDGSDLFDTYRKMAIANGCGEDDPALEGLMPEEREKFYERD